MVSDKRLANTMGGKSARACDNCISKRARWYCAADDAFLCQGCDGSVHSANPLARRHERLRLKASSIKTSKEAANLPSWHHGFTRKARTPRFKKHEISKAKNPLHLVPELCSDENSHEENEEQLLYRVPSFDPYFGELSMSPNSNEAMNTIKNDHEETNESKSMFYDCNHEMAHFHGSLPSEMDLAEFAADVESLLGKGLDDESFDMEGLGLMDCEDKDLMENSLGTGPVKVENDEGEVVAQEFDITGGPFELNFYHSNSMVSCEEEGKLQLDGNMIMKGSEDCGKNGVKKERVICLRLDYNSVVNAWDDQRSPWTNGERPRLDSYECWPYCTGNCGTLHHFGDVGLTGHAPLVDGGREARVPRYREKRRTRLFSKKIRYEVRKLNAEKRPRMKGRFVKRANFPLLK